jgi:hypothetical protein
VVERKGEELELKDDKWIFDFYIRVPEGGVIQFDHIKGRGGHSLVQWSVEIHGRDRGSQYWLIYDF